LLIGTLALTATANADLPPRPDKPPKEEKAARPLVTAIVLNVTPAQDDLWSVVQWQDAQGDWQDIAGWSGWVVDGRTIWWAEEKDWGKGPFRWVVYETKEGSLMATSEHFTLPETRQAPLVVTVAP
jgi:hypothetical protein